MKKHNKCSQQPVMDLDLSQDFCIRMVVDLKNRISLADFEIEEAKKVIMLNKGLIVDYNSEREHDKALLKDWEERLQDLKDDNLK